MNRLIYLALLFLCAGAQASTCSQPTFSELLEGSDYIFTGKVSTRVKVESEESGICWDEGEQCGTKISTFEVFDSLKGDVKAGVKIQSRDACYCLGTYFNIGEHYLVFANDTEDGSIEDIGTCTTDELGYAISEGLLEKLAAHTSVDLNYGGTLVLGSWESFGDPSDKEYEGISKITLVFGSNNSFKAEVLDHAKEKKSYSGVYYSVGDELVIVDEDGFQSHSFSLIDGYLVLTASDGVYRYKLKKI